jgi:DNA-binding winged helix-turn-helix (wHTH) protein
MARKQVKDTDNQGSGMMIYAFEHYELDIGLHELRCTGKTIPLEPLVFNVLVYLVQYRDQAVAKDELIAHLWRGQCMQDGVLVQSVVKARRAIGDNGHAQRCIKTIMGYGYRFIASVEEHDAWDQQARAPILRQSVVPSLSMSRSKVAWPAEDELWGHELPLTDRGQVRALLHALLRRVDERQA